jgi:hypothetical protein
MWPVAYITVTGSGTIIVKLQGRGEHQRHPDTLVKVSEYSRDRTRVRQERLDGLCPCEAKSMMHTCQARYGIKGIHPRFESSARQRR